MLAESLGVNRSLVRVCFTTLMSFTSLNIPSERDLVKQALRKFLNANKEDQKTGHRLYSNLINISCLFITFNRAFYHSFIILNRSLIFS